MSSAAASVRDRTTRRAGGGWGRVLRRGANFMTGLPDQRRRRQPPDNDYEPAAAAPRRTGRDPRDRAPCPWPRERRDTAARTAGPPPSAGSTPAPRSAQS